MCTNCSGCQSAVVPERGRLGRLPATARGARESDAGGQVTGDGEPGRRYRVESRPGACGRADRIRDGVGGASSRGRCRDWVARLQQVRDRGGGGGADFSSVREEGIFPALLVSDHRAAAPSRASSPIVLRVLGQPTSQALISTTSTARVPPSFAPGATLLHFFRPWQSPCRRRSELPPASPTLLLLSPVLAPHPLVPQSSYLESS